MVISSPLNPDETPLSPVKVKSWVDNLEAVERKFRGAYAIQAGVSVQVSAFESYLADVRMVKEVIKASLAAQNRLNELSESERLAAETAKAKARADRTLVGSRTDLVGQWPPDHLARALAYVGLAIFSGGTSILGVVEYLRLGAWVWFAPVFWGAALFFYVWSLQREASNSNRQLDFFDRVLREHAPNIAPQPRGKPWVWSGR